MSEEERKFVEYLEDTLIPDMERNCMTETASDVRRAAEIIRNLQNKLNKACQLHPGLRERLSRS